MTKKWSPWKQLALRSVCLSLFSVSIGSVAFAEDACIGLVTTAEGDWTMTDKEKNSSTVRKYSAIVNGATLHAPSPKDSIEIRLSDHSVIKQHGGKKQNPPIVLKEPTDSLWERAISLFSKQPEVFISTMARGGPAPKDSLVILSDGSVDLGDVFSEMEPKDYRFKLTEVNSQDKANRKEVGQFEVKSVDGKRTPVALPNVPYGLYELALVDPSLSMPPKCWVLIKNSADCATLQQKWQEALTRTKNWKEAENACSRKCFLKALLYSMANPKLES